MRGISHERPSRLLPLPGDPPVKEGGEEPSQQDLVLHPCTEVAVHQLTTCDVDSGACDHQTQKSEALDLTTHSPRPGPPQVATGARAGAQGMWGGAQGRLASGCSTPGHALSPGGGSLGHMSLDHPPSLRGLPCSALGLGNTPCFSIPSPKPKHLRQHWGLGFPYVWGEVTASTGRGVGSKPTQCYLPRGNLARPGGPGGHGLSQQRTHQQRGAGGGGGSV